MAFDQTLSSSFPSILGGVAVLTALIVLYLSASESTSDGYAKIMLTKLQSSSEALIMFFIF